MLDKPTLIVATAFFLSGGLIIAGLGYPSYAKWRESVSAPGAPVAVSPASAAGSQAALPSSSRDDFGERKEDWTAPAASQQVASSPSVPAGAFVLSASEIAKHASATSCWVIINGKVYDMTQHVNGHSGGAQAILSSCGKDGSVAFNTKGGDGRHSSSAVSFLASFYIGELNGPKVK